TLIVPPTNSDEHRNIDFLVVLGTQASSQILRIDVIGNVFRPRAAREAILAMQGLEWSVHDVPLPGRAAWVLVGLAAHHIHPPQPVLHRYPGPTLRHPFLNGPDTQWRDTTQMRRPSQHRPPLRPSLIAAAHHSDLTSAPGLSSHPFDDVISVLRIFTPRRPLPTGVITSADIHGYQGVAAINKP